jgi:DNA-binding MarR family transcriptional regulator
VKEGRRHGPAKARAAKKEAQVEFGSLEDSIFFELRRAQWLVFQSLERRQVERVTPGQATILALVARNAGISQIDLARAVSIERSSLGEIVERLESMGLLRRAHSAHDRRAWALELTEPGRQVVVESLARAADHERYLETFLSARESKSLVRLLKKLSRALAEELRHHDAAEERRARNGGGSRPRSSAGS